MSSLMRMPKCRPASSVRQSTLSPGLSVTTLTGVPSGAVNTPVFSRITRPVRPSSSAIQALGPVGLASSVIAGDIGQGYASFEKPFLSPPAIVFPIVWTILYVLMGVSSYLICRQTKEQGLDTFSALLPYGIQLAMNFAWSIFFFGLELFLFASIWLVLMIFVIIWMIFTFYKIKPIAAYLQIPYLVWCLFAVYLSFGVTFLN